MTLPNLTFTTLAGDTSRPLLVVGPSLGTAVETLWGEVAQRLSASFRVVGWDLPGHGRSPATDQAFSVSDLAECVRRHVAGLNAPADYAGISLGGAVALQLALDPGPFTRVASIASADRIGEPGAWHERAESVRRNGTPTLVAGSEQRWFTEGFVNTYPEVTGRLLGELTEVDDESYARCCEALADHDLRGRLGSAQIPVLVVASQHDQVVTPAQARTLADPIPHHEVQVVADVAHLPAAEAPDRTAALLHSWLSSPYDAGMAVRREVLGDAHVDRATARITPFTEDFQALITEYAWGSVWTRPGLDRRLRSVAVLTALIAHGHWDELAMHVRAARTNGLSVEEIREVIVQSAIYCGVPAANHAFAVAQRVLNELGDDQTP